MNDFEEELALIDSWKEIILESVKMAFKKYDFVVLDYLTNKQWFREGEKSDGKKMKPKYKAITIKLKKKKGDPYDRVTLKDTGTLYKSIDLIVGERALLMQVNVDYYAALEKKYGSKIAGIQEKFLQEFCDNYILPLIEKNINDTIARF
jgi:hypothetical protein